ncbi:GTP cyclohydrolase 1 type 2 homolog YbgI [hydrothermal vent metagenome]|uniref:GTP cyclohydrolase 1 type 2 homolog YbgI n=1 Tax=hydrothermal vent metagenome TaxID=652676 RepID=A0A3B1AS30_9ZZZZ
MVARADIINYCDDLLETSQFKDYCPNGLQVEGSGDVTKIVTGVTASQALIDAAIEASADMLLVHHGFFWQGENPNIIGIKQRRIKHLLQANINLVAYHLPLDAHPLLGNNAQLANVLNLEVEGRFGGSEGDSMAIAMHGRVVDKITAVQFAASISEALNRQVLHIAPDLEKKQSIQTVAWCTGAAQGYIEKAVELGVDAFITGEASEQTAHIARESNIHFFAAGHHATERYGVKALGEHLSQHLDIDQCFIDIDNPI